MSFVRKAGTTDVSVVIRIIDAVDGTPETGVTVAGNTPVLEYRREGAASTAITETDLAALTDAHSDGGFIHIGNGYYRLDLPDAACAAGVTGVLVHGTVSGMVVIGQYIQLVAYDPFDTVRLGLTALPNAAAEASGGLFTRGTGAGQITQSNNGQIDVDVKRINSVTNAASRLALSAAVIIPGTVDNTAFTPTTTQFEADDITEATADHYIGAIILWTSGALLGQRCLISDYALTGGRGHFTVSILGGVAMTDAPANDDTFVIV